MSDASVDAVMERYGPAEITPEAVLRVADDRFEPGSVALVTGAANGIGRATALCLAVNGLTVLGVDLDEADCEAAVAAAAEAGTLRSLANVAGVQHIDGTSRFRRRRSTTCTPCCSYGRL